MERTWGEMDTVQLWSLYYNHAPQIFKRIEQCQNDADFRQIYMMDDGCRKLVVKQAANAFTNRERILGWDRLIREYNKLGIYCPQIVCNCRNELMYEYTLEEKKHWVYAEEFAKYNTVEQIRRERCTDVYGRPRYLDDVLRSVGKVGAMHFDFLSFPSAYCLLEPFSLPDTMDEVTECALNFRDVIQTECPRYMAQVERLMSLFFSNQAALREVYGDLPVSCFQADLNDGNILLDEHYDFAGLIDFNLSGREPVLNYAVRAALWRLQDVRLYSQDDKHIELFWYDDALDDLRIQVFLHNLEIIAENYQFSAGERRAFPILLRYMNSFWWNHIDEIKRVKDDNDRIHSLLCWLERQMTRNDIQLF